MPSRPDETPDQDLAHIVQYAQLAAGVLQAARAGGGNYGAPKTLRLFAAEEKELLDYLNGIEERALAARAKLRGESPPMEYLAGRMEAQPGVSKLLRYYDCGLCSKPHWEDERASFDAHIGYSAKQGVRFGHRTELGLVR